MAQIQLKHHDRAKCTFSQQQNELVTGDNITLCFKASPPYAVTFGCASPLSMEDYRKAAVSSSSYCANLSIYNEV